MLAGKGFAYRSEQTATLGLLPQRALHAVQAVA